MQRWLTIRESAGRWRGEHSDAARVHTHARAELPGSHGAVKQRRGHAVLRAERWPTAAGHRPRTMSRSSPSRSSERRLNLACTEAKAAAKAAPDDAALAAACVKAKAAFKKHQQRREQRAENRPRQRAPAPAASDSWTCAVCSITISVADPRAKEQHLAGKAHAKKAKAAARRSRPRPCRRRVLRATSPATGHASSAAAAPGRRTRAAHDGGKRHQERLAMLVALAPQLKKGDWVCCSLAEGAPRGRAAAQLREQGDVLPPALRRRAGERPRVRRGAAALPAGGGGRRGRRRRHLAAVQGVLGRVCVHRRAAEALCKGGVGEAAAMHRVQGEAARRRRRGGRSAAGEEGTARGE